MNEFTLFGTPIRRPGNMSRLHHLHQLLSRTTHTARRMLSSSFRTHFFPLAYRLVWGVSHAFH